MAAKKKSSSRGSMSKGRTTAKQAAANRYAAKGYKGATKMGAGRSIAVENKRAGARANPKAVKKVTAQMSKKAPKFVAGKAGSKNVGARAGREIMRQNQAYVNKRGTTRSKAGQQRIERAQGAKEAGFRRTLESAKKAHARAVARGDKAGANKAMARHRAAVQEYKGWRKGGSNVNAGG